MPEIVVTAATREAQSPDSTATTTTVLTHQYLEDSRFVDVESALQLVPGLSTVVSGVQGGQTSVFIHGLDSNQTLVTIDGRRQAVGLSGADDNLANLTLDDVDQIEIVRTPVSSTDGAGAMGGVINLVTLSGRGLTQPISSVSFEGGSFNSYRENIQSRGAEGNFDYAVSAMRQDASYPALSPGDPAFGIPVLPVRQINIETPPTGEILATNLLRRSMWICTPPTTMLTPAFRAKMWTRIPRPIY